jgi:hypothetical protein
MNVKKFAVAALSLAVFSSTARARIGESFAECVARYGTPVSVVQETKQAYFQVGALLVGAGFFDGKCDFLYFSKGELGNVGIADEFSDTELKILMEASSNGQPWEKISGGFGKTTWGSDAVDCLARYDALERHLIITTKDFLKREALRAEEEDKQKLKGF